jgi:hypothetical protein
MSSDLLYRMRQKGLYEEYQAKERANEIARCLVYESFQIIERTAVQDWRKSVVLAFANLARVKAILGDSFENIREELCEKAKKRFSAFGHSEEEIEAAAYEGEYSAETFVLPTEMGEDSIHYGFVAEMFFISKVWFAILYYRRGHGWRIEGIQDENFFEDYPRERGIKGLIYSLMRQKIDVWREALERRGVSVRGVGGWLEKLEKNINDPDWLSKVEELLLRVDYFGVEIVSDDP